MIGNIGGIAGIVISILMIILLLIGLWSSKLHSFIGGVFFFLLLIIHEVYSFISPLLIRNYIDTLSIANKEPLFGMTIGELVLTLSLIPKLIVLAAFICLIFGLKKLWNVKSVSP
ncbi:hypothetical protein [Ornithinibacillus halotolerans]|uniref:Uncharacterized protein n=1 Tax=Ornithinibacillus halotolerans TaxID=1274357 RepID=A0A916RKR7_9BACI|nr:hypothetical protein [Ornithinibacillus halotolerans]GGA60038.1 hypothetical protein GCM10008025_00090 [Ornithinibacillus halotolerans]